MPVRKCFRILASRQSRCRSAVVSATAEYQESMHNTERLHQDLALMRNRFMKELESSLADCLRLGKIHLRQRCDRQRQDVLLVDDHRCDSHRSSKLRICAVLKTAVQLLNGACRCSAKRRLTTYSVVTRAVYRNSRMATGASRDCFLI